MTSNDDDDEDDDMELLVLLTIMNSPKPTFSDSLGVDGRRCRSRNVRRAALQDPAKLAFWTLYNSGQDDGLITLCGFDYASFNALHNLFRPVFDAYTPINLSRKNGLILRKAKKVGRKRLLTSVSCLALGLAWTRTRGSSMVLQIIFGITKDSLSIWLRFSWRVITKVLMNHPDAKVSLPTDDEIASFKQAIHSKYSRLPDCWGAMDGLKLRLQCSANETQQNNFYNGWTHDHYVTNLFLFSTDGKIRSTYFNAPGVLHDSTLAQWSKTYQDVHEIYTQTGAKVVVDSAFASNNLPSLIKSHQSNIDA